jgi:hypothetical protein
VNDAARKWENRNTYKVLVGGGVNLKKETTKKTQTQMGV